MEQSQGLPGCVGMNRTEPQIPYDWADELAAEIIACAEAAIEISIRESLRRTIAVSLRCAHARGKGAGLDEAMAIMRTAA